MTERSLAFIQATASAVHHAEDRGYVAWDCFQASGGAGSKCYMNIQAPFWLQRRMRLNLQRTVWVVCTCIHACCKLWGWFIGGSFAALRQQFFPEKIFFLYIYKIELFSSFRSALARTTCAPQKCVTAPVPYCPQNLVTRQMRWGSERGELWQCFQLVSLQTCFVGVFSFCLFVLYTVWVAFFDIWESVSKEETVTCVLHVLHLPFLVALWCDASLIAKRQEADGPKQSFDLKPKRHGFLTKLNGVMVSNIKFILRMILSRNKEHTWLRCAHILIKNKSRFWIS